MIYFIKTVSLPYVKIGYSKDIQRRLEGLRGTCPLDLEVLMVFRGGREVEEEFHVRFKDSHLHHEWFHFSEEIKEYLAHPKLMPYLLHEVPPKKRKDLRKFVKGRIKYSKETSYAKRHTKSL